MVLNFGRKTGRKSRLFDQTVPHWSSLRLNRTAQTPPIPYELSWLKGMPDWLGMMLNGPTPNDPNALELGDCTNAAAHHMKQIWTFHAEGTMITDPDSAVLQGYEESCGYVLNDPSTDQGGSLQEVLKYWMSVGMPDGKGGRDKIAGFIEIDPRNSHDVRQAIAECGGVYCGAAIPEAWGDWQPGQTWDLAGQGVEGHCVIGVAYDQHNVTMDSWGFPIPTTNNAITAYFDEIYAVVSPEWIEKTGKTPFGMDKCDLWNTLKPLQFSADQLFPQP
jgi:hypothetical protein